jgi:hypothetical protein
MFSIIDYKFLKGKGINNKYIEAACLSTDEKLVGGNISTGSLLHEVDTGKVYAYDEEANSGAGDGVEQFSFKEE